MALLTHLNAQFSKKIIFTLILLVLTASILLWSFLPRIYKQKFDDFGYHFAYSPSNILYPYIRFLSYADAPSTPPISNEVLVCVSDTQVSNGIDLFFSFMQKQRGITSLVIFEKGTIIVDKVEGVYTRYGYDAFDTSPSNYNGIIVSLKYKERTIMIDFIAKSQFNTVDNAYELFLRTFTLDD